MGGVAIALVATIVAVLLLLPDRKDNKAGVAATASQSPPPPTPTLPPTPTPVPSPTPSPSPSAEMAGTLHTLSTPPEAGGLQRDLAVESVVRKDIAGLKRKLRVWSDGLVQSALGAVYWRAATPRTPSRLLFMGGILTVNRPQLIVTSILKGAAPGAKITTIDPGSYGGAAACTTNQDNQVICAWADEDTLGVLISGSPDVTQGSLAGLLPRMRADIEGTR